MPSFLSGKKLVLIGVVVVLLVAIPLTVFLLQQQQKTNSSAIAATNLTLTPVHTTTTLQQTVSLDVNMDPGINQVSFVKVLINYDATKLATGGAGFVPNTNAFPSVLQGPVYGPGTILVTLSIGGSPQNVIQAPTKVGTVSFTAIGVTDAAAPTQITFGNQTQVLSIGSTDQFNENVLSTTTPADITITEGTAVSPTDSPTPTSEPTAEPTAVPTDSPTPTPTTAAPTYVPTAAPTAAPTQIATATSPVCSSLVLDRAASGTAPYSINLTATGSSSNSTISKVTMNFGDGQTQDITTGGGIGTNSISILQSHVYTTAGTFTATATLTDASGIVSSIGSCSIAITVSAGSTQIAANPSPLPPTGPSQLITIGAIGAILSIVGALLLFAL